MTPKEKAEELVTKYRRCLPMNLTTILDVKNCAIIAVDEILDLNYPAETLEDLDDHLTYWDLVIEEIEKL